VADSTSFTPFEARVSALLADYPEMPATVIAERVGWQGSITWFRDNVRRLRPEHRRPDPADRLTWAPGDAAQCDLWFPPTKVPLEDGTRASPPVLVIVAAHASGSGELRPGVRAERGGRLMATKTTTIESVKQISYLASALKAPRISDAATRFADQARDAGWSFEDYLAAVLERAKSPPATRPAHNSGSGPRGSPDAKPSTTSTGTPNPRSGRRSPRWLREGSSPRPATWSCSDHQAPGRPTWRSRWGSSPRSTISGCCSPPRPTGSPG
jgi:hypothetical protein